MDNFDKYHAYNEQFDNCYANAGFDALIAEFGYFGNIEEDNDFWRAYDAGNEL